MLARVLDVCSGKLLSAKRLFVVGLAAAGMAAGQAQAQQPVAGMGMAQPAAQPQAFYAQDGLQVGMPVCPDFEEEKKDPFSATLEFNQDIFFGFYPMLTGYYDITDRMQFSFYSLLWTNPAFTPSGDNGFGLWTEFGVGLNFICMDGTLNINPQIGILNGVLLSGTDRAQAFEGIVPTLTVNHNDTYTEGELYAGYYLATAAPRTNDFVHWWINGGVKPFAETDNWLSIISVGTHFEQLWLTRTVGGESTNIYTWLGPYTQFALPNGLALRFSAGWDLENTFARSFYKVGISYSF